MLPEHDRLANTTELVTHLYRNVVGVAPGAADLASFVGLLDSGALTQAALALLACQTPLNVASAELVGLAQTDLEFIPWGS